MRWKKVQSKGFVLLYAVLVSGVVLSVGLSLINLITKQIILSSIGRNSQFAYYAADAGKQCAYFWYTSLFPVFGMPSDITVSPPDQSNLPPELFQTNPIINCSGENLQVNQTVEPNGLISNFTMPITDGVSSQASCATVRVSRQVENPGTESAQVTTVIRSSGYNASCNALSGNVNDPRRIERVVYRVDK